MPSNPPENMPRVTPNVFYDDPAAALDWLAKSFGFETHVDDVDAHCARARSAGANILSGLEDMFWGDRTYVAEDLEGHRWIFAQHVRDVAPDQMSQS